MNAQTLHKQLVEVHELDNSQARYLDALTSETRNIPFNVRSAFLHDVAEMLSERPPQGWDELVEALSPPDEFAAAWVSEQDFLPNDLPRSGGWANRAREPRSFLFLAMIFLMVLAGGWTYRHYSATPALSTPCSGAQGPSVETLEAAGQIEYRMPLVLNARYGVVLCLQAFDDDREIDRQLADVIFDRIYLAESFGWALQPVGWEIVDQGDVTGDASQNRSAPVTEEGWLSLTVWFEGDRCNISGGTGFGSLSVDYTYRGRQRTGTVDLGAQYTVWGQCTAAMRNEADVQDQAWSRVVGSHFSAPRPAGESWHLDLGSVVLEPVAVSRDLCRYLRGIQTPEYGYAKDIEPLSARAAFRADPEDAAVLIDGAVLGICPEFTEQRDALQELLNTTNS